MGIPVPDGVSSSSLTFTDIENLTSVIASVDVNIEHKAPIKYYH